MQEDTDKPLPTASDVTVGRNWRKTHKRMNEGLQEVLGGSSVKSVDGVLLWGRLGSTIWGRVVREGLSEEVMFAVRLQE